MESQTINELKVEIFDLLRTKEVLGIEIEKLSKIQNEKVQLLKKLEEEIQEKEPVKA